jgi:hypothetical protein
MHNLAPGQASGWQAAYMQYSSLYYACSSSAQQRFGHADQKWPLEGTALASYSRLQQTCRKLHFNVACQARMKSDDWASVIISLL